jgi:hypothetical protein
VGNEHYRSIVRVVACIAITTAAACSDRADGPISSEPSRPTQPSTVAPSVEYSASPLVRTPPTANQGEGINVELSGDLASLRSGYYWLIDSSNTKTALLWTATGPNATTSGSTNQADWTILDYAVTSPPPDSLVVPTATPPGTFWLCLHPLESSLCSRIEIRGA